MNTETQLATVPQISPLTVMASRLNSDPAKLLNTLKATVFSSARNNEELMALVIVANQYGLNPLTKELYAFPAKGGGIVPVVSVDGWANLANSHPQMDGVDFEWVHDDKKLISCTCVIYRKDRKHPTRVTEYLEECKRNTEPWKMEHRMLRHKAFCQAVRVAFGYAGIYEEDEAQRIAEARDVTPQARAVPLNPFEQAPQLSSPSVKEEAPLGDSASLMAAGGEEPTPTVEGPQESDLLIDFLTGLADVATAEDLTRYAKQSNDFEDAGNNSTAKLRVKEKAAALGCKWSKGKGEFVT